MSDDTKAVFSACVEKIEDCITACKGIVAGRDVDQVGSETESVWLVEPTEMTPAETQNDWHEYDVSFIAAGLYTFVFGDKDDWSTLMSQVDDICAAIDSTAPQAMTGGTIQKWWVRSVTIRREPESWQVFAELSIRANVTITR